MQRVGLQVGREYMNCPSLWFLGFSPFEPLLFAFKESSFIVYRLKSALAWYCRQVRTLQSLYNSPSFAAVWLVLRCFYVLIPLFS